VNAHVAIPISRVGLGGYELGPEAGEKLDLARAVRVLEAALDAGLTWVDTSEAYHDCKNEQLIGDAFRRLGDGLLVATKVAPAPDGSGFRRDEIRDACRRSLARLGRERIDIYFLHRPDRDGVPLEESWAALAELVEEGLVGAVGLSNYGIEAIEHCHRLRRVDFVQDGLSLVDYLDNRRLFVRCRDLGIPVVVYEPLGSGALTGRSIEDVRASWLGYTEWGFYKRLLEGANGERTAVVIERTQEIASRLGVTVPQIAIAWVLAQTGVSAALAGTRNPAHVAGNAAAADLDLADILPELDALIPLGPLFGPSA
jgi:aryl-alcohol dehydrogenase-like predicted oxidoreductase